MLRSTMAATAALVAIALMLGSSATAGQPAASAGTQSDEQIVVIGQRQTEEAIHAFVEQMAAEPRGTHQLARWGQTICPGVIGLHTRYAQFINDRLAQRAEAVGLNVGDPGCRANILIAITANPDAVARDLYDHHKTLLGYYEARGHGTLGRRALLQDFVNSMAPVRWWHVSRTITADGDVIDDPTSGAEAHAIGPGAPEPPPEAPVVRLSGHSSRIGATTHQDFGVAFVIVDARKLHDVSFEALADYIAMVTLAQLDPRADVSTYPTILNLFAHHDPVPEAMTDWDVAYLHGLYGATQDARNAQQQEGQIAHTMATTLQH